MTRKPCRRERAARPLRARFCEHGVTCDAPGYLWHYAWRHAASAGPPGLDALRTLSQREPQLRPTSARPRWRSLSGFRTGGARARRSPRPRRRSSCYRALAAENPAFLPDLAAALNNLGIRYGEVGRRGEAVAPTEEAVERYRALAAENPAYLPDLAGALNNLGVRYGEVGRRGEAVAPTEEAVERYRALAAENPAFPPDLAGALEQPRHPLRRGGAPRARRWPRPRRRSSIYRALAAENPAFLPDLAGALEQPRQPLQRGGAPRRGGGPDRGSGRASIARWPPRTPPSCPTSRWR